MQPAEGPDGAAVHTGIATVVMPEHGQREAQAPPSPTEHRGKRAVLSERSGAMQGQGLTMAAILRHPSLEQQPIARPDSTLEHAGIPTVTVPAGGR